MEEDPWQAVAQRLFAELVEIAKSSDEDAKTLHCVRIGFEDGSQLAASGWM